MLPHPPCYFLVVLLLLVVVVLVALTRVFQRPFPFFVRSSALSLSRSLALSRSPSLSCSLARSGFGALSRMTKVVRAATRLRLNVPRNNAVAGGAPGGAGGAGGAGGGAGGGGAACTPEMELLLECLERHNFEDVACTAQATALGDCMAARGGVRQADAERR